MKKFFYAALAAVMLSSAACGNSEKKNDEIFSQEASDSLAMALGEFAGATFKGRLAGAMSQDSTMKFSEDQFFKGFLYAMAADTTESYMLGVQFGMQIMGEMASYQKAGVKVDQAAVVKAFKEAFFADTVAPQSEMERMQRNYTKWTDSLQTAKAAYEKAKKEADPKAKANIEAGKKYLKDAMAKDASIKETASGLGYKITAAGEGEKIKPTDRVVLKITGKAISGGNPPAFPQTPRYLQQIPIPGLQEGVAMLAKGGKATFYVPGPIGFGVDNERAGVEPNVMVVYEVEVVDIIDPSQQPKQVMPGQQPQVIPAQAAPAPKK